MTRLVNSYEIADEIAKLFQHERLLLSSQLSFVFPSILIEQIGSTAVPNTVTKGDLDINIRVTKDHFSKIVERMKILYRINQPQNWKNDFASFANDSKEIGVQVTIINSVSDIFTKQRDYLIAHPDKVLEYNGIKIQNENRSDDEYRNAKDIFWRSISL